MRLRDDGEQAAPLVGNPPQATEYSAEQSTGVATPATPASDAVAGQPGKSRGGVAQPPWTFRQMVIAVVATLVPWIVFNLGAQAIVSPSATGASKPLSPVLDAISGVVVFIVSAILEALFLVGPLIVVTSRSLPRVPFKQRLSWLGMRRTPLGQAIVVIVVGLVIGLGGSLLYSWLITTLHLPLQTNTDTLLREGKTAPFTTIGILAAAALAAPICEEIFFRGLLFTGLLKRMPLWPAATLSAIIFAIAHLDLGSLIPLFIIGMALAWARWRSDSLWPGMIIHAINNSVAAIVLLPLLLRH